MTPHGQCIWFPIGSAALPYQLHSLEQLSVWTAPKWPGRWDGMGVLLGRELLELAELHCTQSARSLNIAHFNQRQCILRLFLPASIRVRVQCCCFIHSLHGEKSIVPEDYIEINNPNFFYITSYIKLSFTITQIGYTLLKMLRVW